VDEGREPERIEIELTSHEPARPSKRGASTAAGGSSVASGETASGVLETERGRLIAVAAFIGVLALLIGVLVGRAGSDGDVATADSAATTTTVRPRSSTTASGASDPLPTVRTIDTPPPTAPPVATAPGVDQVGPTMGVIAVAPEFTGLGVEIIGLTVGGDVIQVDPATGSTVTHYELGTPFGPPVVFAGPGWILVPTVSSGDQSGAVVLADDGTRSFIDTGRSWPFAVSGDGSGRFWLPVESAEAPGGIRLVEMSIAGEATGSELALTAYPSFLDPLGGVVVDAAGGSYRITVDGASRLTSGRLLAIGRSRVFVEECDETLVCGHYVVERSSGVRRRIEVDPAVSRLLASSMMVPVSSANALNDAEDGLLVAFWDQSDGGQRTGVLDLDTGDFTEFPDLSVYANGLPNVVWGPGGEQVFWLDSTAHLQVLDLVTGVSVRFSEDLGQLNGFALRPVARPA
jgi:hypothetical protein